MSKSLEIKIELLKRGIKQTDIARTLNVKPSVINRVIHGHARSERVEKYLMALLTKKAA